MEQEDELRGIFVEKQLRMPNFIMGYEHEHDYIELFFLKSGSCIYSVNSRPYRLKSGDMYIAAPGDSHSTRYEGLSPCTRFAVYFRPEALDRAFWEQNPGILDNLLRSGKVILPEDVKDYAAVLLQLMLNENNIPDEYSEKLIVLHMKTLLLNLQRSGIFLYDEIKSAEGVSSDIEDCLRFIAQNFAKPLTLASVARQVNLSPSYLSQKFKENTGLTFKEYINFIRIKQACQMLLTTDDSITKIALNCGFNSSNYFKDCFKRICKTPPSVFRKEAHRI